MEVLRPLMTQHLSSSLGLSKSFGFHAREDLVTNQGENFLSLEAV